MKIHLLDVNVLLAMAYRKHVHHFRTKWWVEDLCGRESDVSFAACSVTECGFVRISSSTALNFAETVEAARQDLSRLKSDWPFIFIDDGVGADRLPAWVTKSKQVTDGHLLALAIAHGVPFVTLDRGIPGAVLIPEYPEGPSMIREPQVPYGLRSQIATLKGRRCLRAPNVAA